MRGDVPGDVRRFLRDAALTALPKHDGDWRPIAVGEVLRRLVGKCCADIVNDAMREISEPWHVGMGTLASV